MKTIDEGIRIAERKLIDFDPTSKTGSMGYISLYQYWRDAWKTLRECERNPLLLESNKITLTSALGENWFENAIEECNSLRCDICGSMNCFKGE